VRESLGKTLGESLFISNLLSGIVAPYVEPSPPQPVIDSTRERREIVFWANATIHGLLYA
jgi:hypothetical protein